MQINGSPGSLLMQRHFQGPLNPFHRCLPTVSTTKCFMHTWGLPEQLGCARHNKICLHLCALHFPEQKEIFPYAGHLHTAQPCSASTQHNASIARAEMASCLPKSMLLSSLSQNTGHMLSETVLCQMTTFPSPPCSLGSY